MRLDSWDIRAFGALSDFTVEGLANHPLIVVQGDNESGKSTLMQFFVTMLYGFRPARGQSHPYAPWNGASAEGSAGLVLSNGSRASITRRLGSGPEGTLVSDEGEQALGNRPLPWTGPLSREMYSALHAVSLDELQKFGGDVWKQLEERLLAGSSFPFLNSAGEAREQLDEAAASIWQASNDSGTTHRRVAAELRLLHRQREQAAERSQRALELRTLISGQGWKMSQVTEQLHEMQSRLERSETLLPVLRTIEEIDELRARADERLPTDDFPDDPRRMLDRLDNRIEEHTKEVDRLENDIEHHEQHGQLTQDEKDILQVEDEVRTLVNDAAVHHQDKVHLNDLDRTRDANEALLAERASVVLSGKIDEGVRESLSRLNLNELQSRVKDFEEAKRSPELTGDLVNRAREAVSVAQHDLEELPPADDERMLQKRAESLQTLQSREAVLAVMKQELEGTAEPVSVELDKDKKLIGLGLLGLGLLLGFVIMGGGTTESGLLGTLAVMLTAGGIVVLRRKGNDAPGPDEARFKILTRECSKLRKELDLHEYEAVEPHLKDAHQILTVSAARPTLERRLVNARRREKEALDRQESAGKDLERARQSIAEYLSDAGLSEKRLENPGYDLVADIESMRNTLRDIARMQGERGAIAGRAEERESRANHLAELLDMVPQTQPMDSVPLWQDRLHQALMARRRSEDAERQLPKLRSRRTETEKKLTADRRDLETLTARLAAVDIKEQDAREGLKLLERARTWRTQAETLEASLHETWPDWSERGAEARLARSEGLDLDLPTEDKVDLRQQIDQLQQTLAGLAEEKGRLREEQNRLMDDAGLSDIDGAIEALHERQRHMLRQRDRLALASAVVGEAAQRWRERHQPEVLATASRHLHSITGGRYERITAEQRNGRWTLMAKSADDPYPRPLAHPLSHATRDQIHLALRMALAEEMEGDEAMPLLLDEVFVRWDSERLQQSLALMEQLSEQRQLVVFTSDPEVALMLSEQAGARLVHPPRPVPQTTTSTNQVTAGT